VNIEKIDPKSLTPYQNNSRTHSKEQVEQVIASIKEYGFTNPVLLQGNMIVAGHCRVQAALKMGLTEVPCIRLQGLTEEQIQAYVIADNKLAMNAGWDEKVLQAELQDLLEQDYDVNLTGFNQQELDDLGVKSIDDLADEVNTENEDEVPEVEENIHNVKRGDIWLMGDVHLECDNCGHRVELSEGKNGDVCPECGQ